MAGPRGSDESRRGSPPRPACHRRDLEVVDTKLVTNTVPIPFICPQGSLGKSASPSSGMCGTAYEIV
jgi:hypothetical protein